MTEEYQPISCELYSKFELWIMRRRRLRLAWRDADGGDHIGTITPQDLNTLSGVEYLSFSEHPGGMSQRVRLDHIIKVEVFGK